ncbi:hypothetical protein M408DRAFT_183051 [Serendipita vermifera MAFF 305830]|uniref:Uncharacterized protein n=1 Tax=Serendipita vermifera MAFF 305830 TaxID=933852 RepID=A0A0C2XUK9_SERVB|nr:hypothetical protein M408DRAFT_183051 [Serendipita vermifera MAFF 305830]
MALSDRFVLRYPRGDISLLSSFTNLHTLKLEGEKHVTSSHYPAQQTTLSLRRLKRLCVQWIIVGIQDIQFDIPKLECLDIAYWKLQKETYYARVQTKQLSWRYKGMFTEDEWKDKIQKAIQSELRSVLIQYHNTSHFRFPSTSKEMVLKIFQEPTVNAALSAALRAVTFEGPLGDMETVAAQDLGYQKTT